MPLCCIPFSMDLRVSIMVGVYVMHFVIGVNFNDTVVVVTFPCILFLHMFILYNNCTET